MKDRVRVSDVVSGRITVAMTRQRLSAYQLAALAGLDEKTVRNIVEGRDVRLSTLEAIADALSLPLPELVARPRITDQNP